MERSSFVTQFAKRLTALLQQQGHISNRAKTGVEIMQLAKIAGVSYQMARKYTLGIALPDYHVIPKIASWLNVSPSWLLFGENNLSTPECYPHSLIEIDIELLRYILSKYVNLVSCKTESEKLTNFIIEVIYNVSHINANKKTILPIIDLMLSSMVKLVQTETEKRA